MTRSSGGPNQQQIMGWVERVATFFTEVHGLPPITGRVLGWLMICDPPEQSAAEIARAIGASRASLTTSMRLLTASELICRRTRPGERTAYYRIEEDAWEKVLRRRIANLASFREITRDGMTLLGIQGSRAARIRAAHDTFEWVAQVFANAPAPLGRRRQA